MIEPKYAVRCLKLGLERYIRYQKLNATINCSNSTISIYVNGTSTPTNARISNHHPNIQNYPRQGNKTPWLQQNISIDFIVPNSNNDTVIRARVQQNSGGTIQPFTVSIYQYDANVIGPNDLIDIFKALLLFLNGKGYTDPFAGTPKAAIPKPRTSHIKPYRPPRNVSGTTIGSGTTVNQGTITEEYLERMSRMCLKEIYEKKNTMIISETDLKIVISECIRDVLSDAMNNMNKKSQ